MQARSVSRPLTLISALLLLAGSAPAAEEVEIETVPVAPGVHMLIGQGGNIGVSTGGDGVLLIDDQFAPLEAGIRAAVAKLSPEPIRFVLNTHWHGDHTGGNAWLGRSGTTIVAHDAVRARMSTEQEMRAFGRTVPPSPPEALPVVTFGRDLTLHWNGETIRVIHVPAAHTDGDAIVHFVGANAIHAGDTYFRNGFPYIDLGSGGGIDGVIAAAETILSLADDRTRIIPGHGALSNRAELDAYRRMLVDVRGRVATAIEQGLDADEVVKQGLIDDLAGRHGGGVMKKDDFLRIVHASLAGR